MTALLILCGVLFTICAALIGVILLHYIGLAIQDWWDFRQEFKCE